jgi:hypothetical protein
VKECRRIGSRKYIYRNMPKGSGKRRKERGGIIERIDFRKPV